MEKSLQMTTDDTLTSEALLPFIHTADISSSWLSQELFFFLQSSLFLGRGASFTSSTVPQGLNYIWLQDCFVTDVCFDLCFHRYQFSILGDGFDSSFCHLKKIFVWAQQRHATPCGHVLFAYVLWGYLIWFVIMIKMGDNEKRSDIIKCSE